MKTPTVFTWGYSKHGLEELCSLLRKHDIRHVIDVRARPMSRKAEWRQKQLQAHLGARYIWAECFGNATGDVAEYWQPHDSEDQDNAQPLAAVIRSGMLGNVIAICLEQDSEKCHRSAVAEFIGCQTVHLGGPEVPQE